MQSVPKKVNISVDSLAELAVDCWRLNRWVASKKADDTLTVPKHVLRRLTRFLEECTITTVDLTGQPFDPGLATEVVDAVSDQTLDLDKAVISETIAPIVMCGNVTIKHAQVVVRHNPAPVLCAESEDKNS